MINGKVTARVNGNDDGTGSDTTVITLNIMATVAVTGNVNGNGTDSDNSNGKVTVIWRQIELWSYNAEEVTRRVNLERGQQREL